MALIPIILIIFISFGVKIKVHVFEEEAIFISLIGIAICTYLLGLLNLMEIAIIAIPFVSAISIIYTILKIKNKQEKISDLITLPTILFCIVIGIIYYLTKNACFRDIDEYVFWGTNLKIMCEKNLLWAHSSIDAIHQIYPPFAGIVEYIFCKLSGGFSESTSIFAINILKMTLIMPILRNSKYNVKTFLKSALIMIITYVAPLYLKYDAGTLVVDCLMGVMFAVLLYMSYNLKEKKDYIPYILLLIAMTLVKTNGMLFAGISIMQLFFIQVFRTIKNKEWNKKQILNKILIIVVLLAIVLISFATWKIYCNLNGKKVDLRHDNNSTESISLIETYNAIMQNENSSERNISIVQSFIKKLKTLKMSIQDKYFTTFDIIIGINIIWIIFLIIGKKKLEIFANIISVNIGFVMYCITVLMLFLFVFTESEAIALTGFARYIKLYLLAMILNTAFIITNETNIKSIIFLFIILLILKQNIVKSQLNPSLSESTISQSDKEAANIISENLKDDEKVYIIVQSPLANCDFFWIRYLISPIQTNLMCEWNPMSEIEEYTYAIEISEEELIDKIIEEDYDYVFILNITENFLEDYSEIFDDTAIEELQSLVINYEGNLNEQSGMLFYVDKENRIIKLSE